MRPTRLALVAAAALAATSVAAAKVDPAVAIQARQLGMKQIGRDFKAINDQLRSGSADGKVVAAAAHDLAGLAPKVPSWFLAGTGPETGLKTAAKADIWAQNADFRAKAKALALATRNLDAAARRGGDPAALQPLVGQVGGACKACHTSYKVSEH